jgi:hypothetical protein
MAKKTLTIQGERISEHIEDGLYTFSTHAKMTAKNGVTGIDYVVFNDPDIVLVNPPESNNGYYHWTGSVYKKDASLAEGIIEEGNTDPISGDTAFRANDNLFKALSTLAKTYNSAWIPKGFASVGDATPAATLNHVYFPTENGTIFGVIVNDYSREVLIGNGSSFMINKITIKSVDYDFLHQEDKKYWRNAPGKSYELDRGLMTRHSGTSELYPALLTDNEDVYSIAIPFYFDVQGNIPYILDIYDSSKSLVARFYKNSSHTFSVDSGYSATYTGAVTVLCAKLNVLNVVIRTTSMDMYLGDQLVRTVSLSSTQRNKLINNPFFGTYSTGKKHTYTGTILVTRGEHLALSSDYDYDDSKVSITEALSVDTDTATTINIRAFPNMEIAGSFIAERTWTGYNGNITARLFELSYQTYTAAKYGIGLRIGSTGSIIVQSIENNIYSTIDTIDDDAYNINLLLKFTETGLVLNVNGTDYTYEGDYISRVQYLPASIVVNSSVDGSGNYFWKGKVSELRIGKNLNQYVENYDDSILLLTEKSITENDSIVQIPFQKNDGKAEFSFKIVPDAEWIGKAGNYTSGVFQITSNTYGNSIANGIRVVSGSTGQVSIRSLKNYALATVVTTNIYMPTELNVNVVFDDATCVIEINGRSYSLSGDYLADIWKGGEVVLNPYSGSAGGYYFVGSIEKLKFGKNLDGLTPKSRLFMRTDLIKSLSGSYIYTPEKSVDYTQIGPVGRATRVSKIGDTLSTVKQGIINIPNKGRRKVLLPMSLVIDNTYHLDSAFVKPSNNSAIRLSYAGFDCVNQYVHPSIDYSATALNGYNYFMFVSNYPRENPAYEDDDLLVSADGQNWIRVPEYGSSGVGEPQLPENVFLTGTDNGREKTFVPIPPAGTSFQMNGATFTPSRSLKHDPEILIEGGYLHLYNFYNFYESNGLGGYDSTKYHRFVVVFRTNDLRNWEICRTDGSTITASAANIAEIFSQSSVDGKDNFIRYMNWNVEPNLKDSNMQVVKDGVGTWYAYYKEYGDYTNSNIGLKRFEGTSHLNFDWTQFDYCAASSVPVTQEHPAVFYYNTKFYYITHDILYESSDGINFSPLTNQPFPTVIGTPYKTDVCIGAGGNLFIATSSLFYNYVKPTESIIQSGRDVMTNVFKMSSFADVLTCATSSKIMASAYVNITIHPANSDGVSFNVPLYHPNSTWVVDKLIDYDFKGGEEVSIAIVAHSIGASAFVTYGDFIFE